MIRAPRSRKCPLELTARQSAEDHGPSKQRKSTGLWDRNSHFDPRRGEPRPIPARSRSFTEDNEGNEEAQDGMAFGPSDLSANGAAPSQPGANAPGQSRKSTMRAVGPNYHPRQKNRAFSPLVCRWTLLLGRCPRLGWPGPSALSNSHFDLRSRDSGREPSPSRSSDTDDTTEVRL